MDQVRRPGTGRKRMTVLVPGLASALQGLVEPVTRGDSESPLRWTSKSTRHLAAARAGQNPVEPWPTGHLRGHQAEGTGRVIQERGAGVAAAGESQKRCGYMAFWIARRARRSRMACTISAATSAGSASGGTTTRLPLPPPRSDAGGASWDASTTLAPRRCSSLPTVAAVMGPADAFGNGSFRSCRSIHLAELARATAADTRRHRQPHRCDANQDGPQGALRPRHSRSSAYRRI